MMTQFLLASLRQLFEQRQHLLMDEIFLSVTRMAGSLYSLFHALRVGDHVAET